MRKMYTNNKDYFTLSNSVDNGYVRIVFSSLHDYTMIKIGELGFYRVRSEGCVMGVDMI